MLEHVRARNSIIFAVPMPQPVSMHDTCFIYTLCLIVFLNGMLEILCPFSLMKDAMCTTKSNQLYSILKILYMPSSLNLHFALKLYYCK